MKIRRRDIAGKFLREHGLHKTPEYSSWSSMWDRVRNKNNPQFKYWGGRGIAVCKRWGDFNNFIKDMGTKPKGFTLERINNNEGYFPFNCRWASRLDQSRNSRFNRHIRLNGKTMILSDWARYLKINISTLSMRLDHYGWSIRRALCE